MLNLDVPRDIFNKVNSDLGKLKERIELFQIQINQEDNTEFLKEKLIIHNELLSLNFLIKKFLKEMLFDPETSFFKVESEQLHYKIDNIIALFLSQLETKDQEKLKKEYLQSENQSIDKFIEQKEQQGEGDYLDLILQMIEAGNEIADRLDAELDRVTKEFNIKT